MTALKNKPTNRDVIQQAYRDALFCKRVLIVLDDVQNAEQVAPLVPPAGCALIFTSQREFMVGNCSPHLIGRMSDEEAAELLRSLYPPLGAEDANALIGLCGGLPLALRIIGCHLKMLANRRGGVADVASYIKRLSDGRLDALNQGAPRAGLLKTLSKSLGLSEEHLTPPQKRAWWRLSVFGGSFDESAGRAVAEADDDLFETLESLSLLEYIGDRYRLHDIVRDFAQPRLKGDAALCHAAHLNHAAHFLAVLKESNRLIEEGGESTTAGLRLFDAEWQNIEAGQKWVCQNAETGDAVARLSIDYPSVGGHALNLRVHKGELIQWQQNALRGFERLESKDENDAKNEALLLHNLGLEHSKLGDMAEAIVYYQRSLTAIKRLENFYFEAVCRGNYGWACHKSERQQAALEHYRLGLEAVEQIPDAKKQLSARIGLLTNQGIAHKDAGEFDLALDCYEAMLQEARQIADLRMEGNVLGNIGIVYDLKEEHRLATEYFDKQYALAEAMKDKRGQASALFNKALATHALKDTAAAIRLAETALVLYQLIDDPMTADVEQELTQWRDELNAVDRRP